MSKGNTSILAPVEVVGAKVDAQTLALENQFRAACTAFNAHDINVLGPMLDENVTVFSVSSNRPITGINAVKNWFAQEFIDIPEFYPLTPIKITQNATTGTVAGVAQWTDAHGAEAISFVFTFVFVGGQWLLLTVWGS